MRQKKDEPKARPDQQINGADEASVAISTQPARDIRISSSNAFLFLELETRRILGRPGNVDAYEAARLAGPNRPAMYVAIQTDAIANAGGKCDTHFYCTPRSLGARLSMLCEINDCLLARFRCFNARSHSLAKKRSQTQRINRAFFLVGTTAQSDHMFQRTFQHQVSTKKSANETSLKK